MFTGRRYQTQWNLAPASGRTSTMKLTPGLVLQGFVLSVFYTVNVTGAGLAVRTRSVPIRRIALKAGNKYIKIIKAVDALTYAQLVAGNAMGAMVVPANGAAVAFYGGLEAHIPIYFCEPFAENGDLTAMPSWAYQDLIVEVEWGDVTDLFTDGGTLAGAIAFDGAALSGIAQLEVANLNVGNGVSFAKAAQVSVERYVEAQQGAVANLELELPLLNGPRQIDRIRSIQITQELTSNGEPTASIIKSVSLKENNSTLLYTKVPRQTLVEENVRIYRQSPAGPGGAVLMIEFAEDKNIASVYNAADKRALSLVLETAAVAGNIRAAMRIIEASPF